MKSYSAILLILFSFLWSHSQSLIGAWETEKSVKTDSITKSFKIVFIFSENHHVASAYDAKTGAFIATFGGSWSTDDNSFSQTIEFDSENPDRIGSTKSSKIKLQNDELHIENDNLIFKRVDNGTPGTLNGAWLMSGRKRNGEFQTRDTNRPRKTMKILSGTRFQWIAYNTETKQFMGTGGGTYTTIDGKYTENIEFFSRDDSRVGASLEFNFELKEGDWHHSGFSSKGNPLYEVWSLRK